MTRQTLRSYQRDAVRAIEADWTRGLQRVAIQLPTGTGKTSTFADVIERWCLANPGRRVVVVAHRTELIEQAAARIRRHCALPVGIVKAERNQTRARVVVASIQTLASRGGRRAAMIADVGLVVVDEAHRAAAQTYVEALKTFGCWEPAGARALGVSATLSRSDGLALGDVWQTVSYEYTIAQALADGYLVRPRGLFVKVEDLDLRGVRKTGGDYRDGDLGEAIVASLAPKRIAEAYREHADDRSGIVFCPTIASAEAVLEALRADGRAAELVTGKTPAGEREKTVKRYAAGHVQTLVNVGVFTEGTDLPRTGVIVVARPTLHSGLYIQMVGRGLRLWCPNHQGDPGSALSPCCPLVKRDALVLDVVGATRRHRLQAEVDLFGDDVMKKRERELDDDELADDDLDIDVEGVDDELPGDAEPVVRIDPLGRLIAVEVDLFHGTVYDWQRTRKGAWFLSLDGRYLVVLPERTGGMTVFSVPAAFSGAWSLVGPAADLTAARTMAEVQIMPGERSNAHRKSGWRRKSPSAPQLNMARRYGVAGAELMTSGELSTRLGIELASARIDGSLPEWMFA